MNEEKIIEEIKSLSPSEGAIQGLLDLYQTVLKQRNELAMNLSDKEDELQELKEKNKELDRENQALYESINCDDKNMLERLYKEEKEKNKKAIEYINKNCSTYNCDYMDSGVGNLFKDILELLEERN